MQQSLVPGLDPHGREVQPGQLGRRGRPLGRDAEARLGPRGQPRRACWRRSSCCARRSRRAPSPPTSARSEDQRVRLRNSTPANVIETVSSPAHQASACHGARPGRRAQQQAAERLDDRRDRLVLGEALEPRRHRGDRDERAARVGQEHHEEREAVGRLGRPRQQADRPPRARTARARRPAGRRRRRPTRARSACGPEADAAGRRRGRARSRRRCARRWPPRGPARTAGAADVQRAEAVDDPAGHVVGDADRGDRRAEAGAQQQHARDDVGHVVACRSRSRRRTGRRTAASA